MVTKKTFCKVLDLIREQDQINSKVEEALQLVGKGWSLRKH